MNELDPSLKRLLNWSRPPEAFEPDSAPPGFSNRVLASARHSQRTTLLQELQQTAWGIACVSLAILMCGVLVLFNHRVSATPEPELSSALNFVANNLLQ
jgi:hypothetical protein